MEITKEQIEKMVRLHMPFGLRSKRGKMLFPFKTVEMFEKTFECLSNGIYEELSKLHQTTVINTLFCSECNGEMQYSGLYDKIECVECGCDLAK